MSETDPEPPASLLSLPMELRHQIYEIVLDQTLGYNPDFYLCIALVCHRVRNEVFPLILKNTRSFRSIEDLHDWTSSGEEHLLKLVNNVSVSVYAESLLPLSEALAKSSNEGEGTIHPSGTSLETVPATELQVIHSSPERAESLSTKHTIRSRILNALCFSGLKEIEQSESKTNANTKDPIALARETFSSISSVKKLYIHFRDPIDPENQRSFETEQQFLLNLISTTCLLIEDLTVLSPLFSLTFLKSLVHLRSLRFPGYSSSFPLENQVILQELKELDTLIIYRPESYDQEQEDTPPPEDDTSNLALTPSVIENLNPLIFFQIHHLSSLHPSPYTTPSLLTSLSTHYGSLRIFQLTSDSPLTLPFLHSLHTFISSPLSHLTDLKIQVKTPVSFKREGIEAKRFVPRRARVWEASLKEVVDSNGVVRAWLDLFVIATGEGHWRTHGNRSCICGW